MLLPRRMIYIALWMASIFSSDFVVEFLFLFFIEMVRLELSSEVLMVMVVVNVVAALTSRVGCSVFFLNFLLH